MGDEYVEKKNNVLVGLVDFWPVKFCESVAVFWNS